MQSVDMLNPVLSSVVLLLILSSIFCHLFHTFKIEMFEALFSNVHDPA
jgi:hypothetical protein